MSHMKAFWMISIALGLGLLIYFPGGQLARFSRGQWIMIVINDTNLLFGKRSPNSLHSVFQLIIEGGHGYDG